MTPVKGECALSGPIAKADSSQALGCQASGIFELFQRGQAHLGTYTNFRKALDAEGLVKLTDFGLSIEGLFYHVLVLRLI